MSKSRAEKKEIIFDTLRQAVEAGSVEVLCNILLSKEISLNTKKKILSQVKSFFKDKDAMDEYLSSLPEPCDYTPEISVSTGISADHCATSIWSPDAKDTGWPNDVMVVGSLNSDIFAENSM